MANGAGKFLGGLVLGGAIGTITGLLVAPRSGRETRKLLRKSADALPDMAEELSSNMQYQADRLTETAQRTWGDTVERLQDAIAAGQEASQKLARELNASATISQVGLADQDDDI